MAKGGTNNGKWPGLTEAKCGTISGSERSARNSIVFHNITVLVQF